MGHVTLIISLLAVWSGLHIVYLCAKLDDSSITHSRDITGGPKM